MEEGREEAMLGSRGREAPAKAELYVSDRPPRAQQSGTTSPNGSGPRADAASWAAWSIMGIVVGGSLGELRNVIRRASENSTRRSRFSEERDSEAVWEV